MNKVLFLLKKKKKKLLSLLLSLLLLLLLLLEHKSIGIDNRKKEIAGASQKEIKRKKRKLI